MQAPSGMRRSRQMDFGCKAKVTSTYPTVVLWNPRLPFAYVQKDAERAVMCTVSPLVTLILTSQSQDQGRTPKQSKDGL